MPSVETPLEQITKINIYKGKYRLLVAGGFDGNTITADVEILDLDNPNLVCSSFPPFRLDMGMMALQGGLTFLERPIICGGIYSNTPSRNCRMYTNGAWQDSSTLLVGNAYFDMTQSPLRNKSVSLLLTGGYNGTNLFNTVQVNYLLSFLYVSYIYTLKVIFVLFNIVLEKP
jgi:hypothetical protein